MWDYNDYYEQCSFYGGPNHYPSYTYGYQDHYSASQGGAFGEPLRELPDKEQGGVDVAESIQSDDGEESGSDLEGDSQPTTSSRAKSASSMTQVIILSRS